MITSGSGSGSDRLSTSGQLSGTKPLDIQENSVDVENTSSEASQEKVERTNNERFVYPTIKRVPIWVIASFSAVVFLSIGNVSIDLALEGESSGIPWLVITYEAMGFMFLAFLLSPLALFNKLWLEIFHIMIGKKLPWVQLLLIGGALFNWAGLFAITLAFQLAPEAQGISLAITAASSVPLSLASWLVLKEKISTLKWAGIFIAVGGIILISLFSGTNQSSTYNIQAVMASIVALSLWAVSNFLVKVASIRGADSTSIAIITTYTKGLGGVLLFIVFACMGEIRGGLDPLGSFPVHVCIALAAGFCVGCGVTLIFLGVKLGPAGPVAAVGQANSLLVLIIDAMIFKVLPSGIAILGGLITTLGVILMTVPERLLPCPQLRPTMPQNE